MGSRRVLGLVSVLIVTGWIYGPVTNAPLVYEDRNWSDQLTDAHAQGLFGRVPGRGLTQETYRVQGATPRPLHVVNVLLHGLNGVLVYALTGSLVGAAVFLWHPLATEAVSYVSGRSDLLVTLGLLLVAVSAQRGVVVRAIGMTAGCLVALTSKELGIVSVPLAIWLWPGVSRWVVWLAVGMGALLVAPVLPSVAVPDWWAGVSADVMGLWRLGFVAITGVGMNLDPDPWFWPWPHRLVGSVALVAAVWCAWQFSALRWSLVWVGLVLGIRVLVPSTEPIHDAHAYPVLVAIAVLGAQLYEAWRNLPLVAVSPGRPLSVVPHG